jgi:hypothetical protein
MSGAFPGRAGVLPGRRARFVIRAPIERVSVVAPRLRGVRVPGPWAEAARLLSFSRSATRRGRFLAARRGCSEPARMIHVECAGRAVASTALSNAGKRPKAPVAPLLPRRCRRSRFATAVHVCPWLMAGAFPGRAGVLPGGRARFVIRAPIERVSVVAPRLRGLWVPGPWAEAARLLSFSRYATRRGRFWRPGAVAPNLHAWSKWSAPAER